MRRSAKVYTLNTLLILVIFFLMLRWRATDLADKMHTGTAINAGEVSFQITSYGRVPLCGCAGFGLALGVHHVTVGLTLPAIAIIVYRTQGVRFSPVDELVMPP